MAAFQALGGFISTFANSDETGLSLDNDGFLINRNISSYSDPLNCRLMIVVNSSTYVLYITVF